MYDKETKKLTAQRIKEEREKKSLSHEKLAAALNEEYSKKNNTSENFISSGVLKNYEVAEEHHSKFDTGFGMRVEYLVALAEFFNVSCDYLLGRDECKKADNREINKKYGLGDEALKAFEHLKIEQDKERANKVFDKASHKLRAINFLIENEEDYGVFLLIAEYLWADYEGLFSGDTIDLTKRGFMDTETMIQILLINIQQQLTRMRDKEKGGHKQ